MSAQFPCPCCGYITLAEEPPGTFAIWPVCFWEDDSVQFEYPDRGGGANAISLRQAQANFSELGASEERFRPKVREPRLEEARAPQWRPLPQAGA